MRKRLAEISYTVLERYLQENWREDASWITIMLKFRENLQQVSPLPPPPSPESGWLSFLYVQRICLKTKNRKVTPSADCSFLFVCFLIVGTNWGLRVYNKQCQPLGYNNRPVWNPENYTLALSSTIEFSTAPVQNCSAK